MCLRHRVCFKGKDRGHVVGLCSIIFDRGEHDHNLLRRRAFGAAEQSARVMDRPGTPLHWVSKSFLEWSAYV